MNDQMPSFLSPQPPTPAPAPSKEVRELEIQTWHIAFETILEKMSEGMPFDRIVREYQTPSTVPPLSPARLRTWIFSNQKRKQAYVVAKALGAEAVEDDLLRISDGLRPDGTASMDDVPRSTLRINTRKWLLTVWNREKYGEVKKVEQTTTTKLDASSLSTAELRAKLLRSLGMDAEDALFDLSPDPDDDPLEQSMMELQDDSR